MANIAQLIAAYAGDPTGVSTTIFDAPLGALVLDTTGGPPRYKTTPFGDNSGITGLANTLGTTQSTVPAGVTDTVPAGSQIAIFGTWTISGTVIIAGEARVGPWPF